MKPLRVAGRDIVRVIDEWRVHDRWWTDQPETRDYMEVELRDRHCVVLVRQPGGAWDLLEKLDRKTPELPPHQRSVLKNGVTLAWGVRDDGVGACG
jgi:hypothetical protein